MGACVGACILLARRMHSVLADSISRPPPFCLARVSVQATPSAIVPRQRRAPFRRGRAVPIRTADETSSRECDDSEVSRLGIRLLRGLELVAFEPDGRGFEPLRARPLTVSPHRVAPCIRPVLGGWALGSLSNWGMVHKNGKTITRFDVWMR